MKIAVLLFLICLSMARADTYAEKLRAEIIKLTPIDSKATAIPDAIKKMDLIYVTKGVSDLGGKEYFIHAKTDEDIHRAYWITWAIFEEDKIASIHVFKAK